MPRIVEFPMRPNSLCGRLFPPDSLQHPLPDHCPHRLGRDGNDGPCNFPPKKAANRGRQVPIRIAPYHSFRDFHRSLLRRRGYEERLWQNPTTFASPDSSRKRDIYDGELFRSFPGLPNDDTRPFYTSVGRLSVSLFYDGMQIHRGAGAATYSVGLIWLTLNNLPRNQRYLTENMCFSWVVPVPSEPPFHAVSVSPALFRI